MADASDILVISENTKNPCFALVLEQTGSRWKPRPKQIDLNDLVEIKRLISIWDTFSLAAL